MYGILAFIAVVIFVRYYFKWRFKELNERDENMKKWDDYL